MRLLLIGESDFLEETSFLLKRTSHEVSGCSLQAANIKIAVNHPDVAIIHLKDAYSIPSFFLQLQQTLASSQGGYHPVLVGLIPHETSREQYIKYYNIGFELVVEAPIDLELLTAQINVFLRKIAASTAAQSPHLLLEEKTRDCFLKTNKGELLAFFKATPLQFDIISLLIKKPRWVWSREHLEEVLSDKMSRFDRRAIDSSINRLRDRLKTQIKRLPLGSWQIDPSHKHPFIHTEYGGGYYFQDCLQLGREQMDSQPRLPTIRQGEFMLQPGSTPLSFPLNIQECAYSWDPEG